MKNDLALFGVGCIFALFTAVSPAGTLPTAKTSVLYVATTGNDEIRVRGRSRLPPWKGRNVKSVEGRTRLDPRSAFSCVRECIT